MTKGIGLIANYTVLKLLLTAILSQTSTTFIDLVEINLSLVRLVYLVTRLAFGEFWAVRIESKHGLLCELLLQILLLRWLL